MAEPLENVFLEERSARDIDTQVSRVLRDLGNPEPPLRLELVRAALELDKAYYSSSDHDILQETVHRLKVGVRQIIRRPSLLWDIVRKLQLRALWIPDRKRILIDSELPTAKQRWGEAHEIGHSIIPWHDEMMHGDQLRTLSITCEQTLEAEANYAAGRLLFLQEAFTEYVLANPLSFDRVKDLSKIFGNTMTSTLWRVVESVQPPTFGLVSCHPKKLLVDKEQTPVRYFLRSRLFARQFRRVTDRELLRAIQRFCYGNRGPVGSDEVLLTDVNGLEHVFFLETFFNGHEALTLGVYRKLHAVTVSVIR